MHGKAHEIMKGGGIMDRTDREIMVAGAIVGFGISGGNPVAAGVGAVGSWCGVKILDFLLK